MPPTRRSGRSEAESRNPAVHDKTGFPLARYGMHTSQSALSPSSFPRKRESSISTENLDSGSPRSLSSGRPSAGPVGSGRNDGYSFGSGAHPDLCACRSAQAGVQKSRGSRFCGNDDGFIPTGGEGGGMDWLFEDATIDWAALSELYRIAPLGEKAPDDLRRAFAHSMYKCFVLEEGALVGAGRAVADGVYCAYLCDIVVHPDFQGRGLGKAITQRLVALSAGH